MMAGLMVLGMTTDNIVKTNGWSAPVISELITGYPGWTYASYSKKQLN
ncbi:hypothetical protein M8332_05905 [Fructilactobacillus ixorae]|uniref:Uncharacterized protein n=1 Tax=Fructilactobacillus ixorae TaxID=1750535 RepID=A0ABY5C2W8_9LACO|nr:hypothetical protein [Fructilactobacillus ixorae]USS93127.1 hypothetical protein M8332_05905 [Fructilactobacillus ixorae]